MTDEQIDDTKPSLMVSFFLEREIFREALSDFVNPRPKPYEGDKKHRSAYHGIPCHNL